MTPRHLRIGEVRLVAAQPVAARRQIVVVDEHEQIAARGAHAGVARTRTTERREAKHANARIARERLDAREIRGGTLRALLDDHDLEAVVVLREQRLQQLGERGEPVVRTNDHRHAWRRDRCLLQSVQSTGKPHLASSVPQGTMAGASVWISTRCQEFNTPRGYALRRFHALRFQACIAVLVMLAVALVACGSRRAEPIAPAANATKLPDGPPLLTPGERMSYRLQIGGMDLATYDVGVGEVTDVGGKRAIVVQSHAKAQGLRVDGDEHRRRRSRRGSTSDRPPSAVERRGSNPDGHVRERTDARLVERKGDELPVDVSVLGKAPATEPQKVTMPDVWDYNALVIALRAWDAKPGSTVTTRGDAQPLSVACNGHRAWR